MSFKIELLKWMPDTTDVNLDLDSKKVKHWK